MKSIQYTIRSIPPALDRSLRQRARRSGKSLNEVVVEVLASGTGVTPRLHFSDLDWFIGKQVSDPTVDASLHWLRQLPKDLQ